MSPPFVAQPRSKPTAISGSDRRERTGAPVDLASAPAPSRSPLSLVPALRPLAPFLCDPDVTDVFVNGAAGLFIDRGAGAEPQPGWRASDEEVRELAVTLIGLGGRHIDDATPAVDVRLEGGLRVHAVLPPIAADGTVISIRVPRVDAPDLTALRERGMFDDHLHRRLKAIVTARENVLVTGAAGAGNTTWNL